MTWVSAHDEFRCSTAVELWNKEPLPTPRLQASSNNDGLLG